MRKKSPSPLDGLFLESKAENTQNGYRYAWSFWERWCKARRLDPTPNAGLLLRYMTDRKLRRGSASQILGAALVYCKEHSLPEPVDERLRVYLKILRRKDAPREVRKVPLQGENVARLAALIDRTTLIGKRDAAIILLDYALANRGAETLSLRVEDVSFQPKEVVFQFKSKTRALEMKVLQPWPDKELCPIRALQDWLQASGIASGPIFRGFVRTGRGLKRRLKLKQRALTTQAFRMTLRGLCAQAGLDARLYGTHSLRSGSITQILSRGASHIQAMKHSGHKSLVQFMKYYRPTLEQLGEVSLLAAPTGKK